jgi:hypothetical protein
MMRDRERGMIAEVADLLGRSADMVATLVETRDVDEEDEVGYDLRIIYSELNRLIDVIKDMEYDH